MPPPSVRSFILLACDGACNASYAGRDFYGRRDGESARLLFVEEGRKRVLAIVAGILVAPHLKSTDDLVDNRGSPRTEAMVAAAVQWAERIMRKIDSVFGTR